MKRVSLNRGDRRGGGREGHPVKIPKNGPKDYCDGIKRILDIGLKKISAKFRWNWFKNKNFKPRDILHMKPM